MLELPTTATFTFGMFHTPWADPKGFRNPWGLWLEAFTLVTRLGLFQYPVELLVLARREQAYLYYQLKYMANLTIFFYFELSLRQVRMVEGVGQIWYT